MSTISHPSPCVPFYDHTPLTVCPLSLVMGKKMDT